MAITTYAAWVNDGAPIQPAVCIADWIANLRSHGYEVGYYPDDRHLKANPPEDHTPYSHTPWPSSQPYPNVLASDLMPPTKSGLPSLARIGAQVVADKNAKVPGTEWIKYINWTDANGNCWHDSWQPTHSRVPSTDKGHIHVSARTDFTFKHHNYDPVARIQGEDVEAVEVWNNVSYGSGANRKTTGQILVQTRDNTFSLAAQITALSTVIQHLADVITAGGGNVDVALIMAGVNESLATFRTQVEADTRDAVADLAEGGSAQVREDAP
jgi:hypothetical protein